MKDPREGKDPKAGGHWEGENWVGGLAELSNAEFKDAKKLGDEARKARKQDG